MDRSKNTGTSHNYLCAINVQWDKFDLSVLKTIKLEDSEKERYLVKPGDLLICEGGDVGRSAIWNSEEEIYYQNALHRVRFFGGIIPRFYLYVLQYYKMNSWIDAVCNGVTIKHFTQNKMNSLLFPLPSTAEQCRIVRKLHHWLMIIEMLDQCKEELQNTIRQTKFKILDLAVHGRLVPQDAADEPAIELLQRINPDFTPCDNGHSQKLPKGWAKCPIREIFDITMGQSPRGEMINNSVGMEFHQGKIFFSQTYLLPSNILTRETPKIADKDSLLLCVRASVGDVNITERKICIGRGLCALKPKVGNLKFYLYLMQTMQKKFEQKATGTTFKAISGDTIKEEQIMLPPFAEQDRIVREIEARFNILEAIQKSLEA